MLSYTKEVPVIMNLQLSAINDEEIAFSILNRLNHVPKTSNYEI